MPDRVVAVAGFRDGVRDLAVDAGIAGAAAALDCDERTVRRHLRAWTAAREGDVPAHRPSVVALAATRVAGVERYALLDGDGPAVLDLVQDAESAVAWLSTRPGRCSLALVAVDPVAMSVLSRALPGVPTAVCPAVAGRSLIAAAIATLRCRSARWREGRNSREDGRLLALPDADLDAGQADELTLWSREARGLRRHLLALLDGIGKGEAVFRKARDGCLDFLRSFAPDARLAALVETWGDAFARGAGQSWMDASWRRIAAFADALSRRHGRDGFDVARIVAVFSEGAGGPDGGVLLRTHPLLPVRLPP